MKTWFPGQRPDEEIIFVKRRHWFVLLRWLTPPVVLFLAMLGIGLVIGAAAELQPLAWALVLLLLIAAPVGLIVWRILDWENDHYILTNQRVVHIERVYFLFESRHEASLNKIQDVTFAMPTLLHNLLNFGDVEIETAGTTGQIRFEAVPNPREVQTLILKAAGLQRQGRPSQEPPRPKPLGLGDLFRGLGGFFVGMLYPVYPRRGVIVWRKHWFVLLKSIFIPTVAALFTAILILALLLTRPIPAAIVVLSLIFLILVAVLAFLFIDWHNDIYILTTDRVIDIEKRPFTHEFRREANMGMIQDVSYEQPSFIAKLLNFGNVRLETAGTRGEFTFDNVPNPREVQNEIVRRLSAYRSHLQEEQARRERERFRQMVQEALQEIVQHPPSPPQLPSSPSEEG